MKTLMLLRHAKSDWNDPYRHDHARPLNDRGHGAAHRMARHMAFTGLRPDYILCSSAVRACETLAPVLALVAPEVEPVIDKGLYMASSADILARVGRVPAGASRVLIVGHNPGLHEAAITLVEPVARDRIGARYPTGALAVITFAVRSWGHIQAAGGTLAEFIRPKTLD